MLRPVANAGEQTVEIVRKRWDDGWLALRARGAHETVVLADDVPDGAVAAVVRHVLTDHADGEVAACRLPACSAVQAWRPSGADEAALVPTRASSA